MYNICVDFRHKIYLRPQKTLFVLEPSYTLLHFYAVQWYPTTTKCHGTEKNVCYGGVLL